jgi:hypothetical protein
MAEPQPLPVIRVERLDGEHEHPIIRELRAKNEKMLRALEAALPILEDVAAGGRIITPRVRAKSVREQVSLTIGAVKGFDKVGV